MGITIDLDVSGEKLSAKLNGVVKAHEIALKAKMIKPMFIK